VSYALGAAVGIVLNLLLAWYRIAARVHVQVWANVSVPLVSTIAAAAVAIAVNRNVDGLHGMVLSSGCAVLVYVALLVLLGRARLAREIAGVVKALMPTSRAAHNLAGALLRAQRLR
jgi:hypothetical protein